MALDARKRRDLVTSANRLKISATVAADSISDATIEHVRRCFTKHELIKIRIATPDRDAFKSAADRLAEKTPCDVVQRLGRIVTLYRPGRDADNCN